MTSITIHKYMKELILSLLFVLTTCFSGYSQAPVASPLQVGAYLPGIINPRDYANPGTSGLFAMDYNIFFTTSQYYDRYGHEVNSLDFDKGNEPIPLAFDISGYLNVLAIAYTSPQLSFLGNARYLTFISPYYSTADYRIGLTEISDSNLTADGGAGGFGDLGIAPLYLTWSLADDKFDLTTGYMFTAPTGRYTTGADDNVGLGYWSHAIQLFTYYYLLEKATALYIGNTFELHSKVKDVDVKPGSRYAIEYGISQYFTERFELTVQGGISWQVGKDSGDDVYWDTSFKDRSSTIGAGVGYWPISDILYFNLKWWTNYALRQSFKTNSFQLQLIYAPGILVSKRDKKLE